MSGEGRRIFNPREVRLPRKEWVTLSRGALCVWEMGGERTRRYLEGIGVEPGTSEWQQVSWQRHTFWQIVASCFDGETEGAQPIFTGEDAPVVDQLTALELYQLMGAITRVNRRAEPD